MKNPSTLISGKKTFWASVNLLPPEMLHKQNPKIALINKISIFTLTTLVFFTSATLALRLSQNFELQNVKKNLVRAEEKVTSLRGSEERVTLLKERLAAIQGIMSGDIKRKTIFNLIVYLIPPEIQVSELSVDKGGNVNLALSGTSSLFLQTLTDNLANQEKNSDMITKVDLDGLSIGKDGIFRASLKIIPK